MRQLQRNLRKYAQVVVNAQGMATAIIDTIPGPSWEVQQISITSTSTALTAASTYRGRNAAGEFISSTLFKGNKNTDSQPNVTLKLGDALCCVWTGGTPGALCTMTVIYDEVAY